MNDLFSRFRAEAPESRQPCPALSHGFAALSGRADRIFRRAPRRDDWPVPHRTVNLLRLLAPVFPSAWERVRAAELIDRCPAEHMIELVGSRPLAEKIADALRFPVGVLK